MISQAEDATLVFSLVSFGSYVVSGNETRKRRRRLACAAVQAFSKKGRRETTLFGCTRCC
jgi:hypothetical protein